MNKLFILRSFKYRDPKSLWVSNTQEIPTRIKPKKITVWYLMYREVTNKHYIRMSNVYNDEKRTIRQMLKIIHSTFVDETNSYFRREASLTKDLNKVEHIIAIHS